MLPLLLVYISCSFAAPALAALEASGGSLQARGETIEDLAHDVVEYIPFVGTVYAIHRGVKALDEGDTRRVWSCIADATESSIRDVVLMADLADPITVTLVHDMAASFTEDMIKIYHSPPKTPEIRIKHILSKNYTYVLVAGSHVNKNAAQYFSSMAKGIHYFWGADFVGTLRESEYAWQGEQIRLQVPRGFYDGGPIMISWRWTKDATGAFHRPEASHGLVRLTKGQRPRFDVTHRKGAGDWEGYQFWGFINSLTSITLFVAIGEERVKVELARLEGT
ncbi:hypothetical protein PLIIFM63780_008526 [Purpureocillium lilacinum]|nr:hypothetical protein PLIIFM63780_008526 [Purpureocillium lilacinum]